ncbi:hypothetical protein ABIE67_002098 [Streptomyces sp. V4I8]
MPEGFVHRSMNRDTRVRLKASLKGRLHTAEHLSTLQGVVNVTN